MDRRVQVGMRCTLKVGDRNPQGVFLMGEEGQRAFLPLSQLPSGAEEGDELTVFVHTDSRGQPTATTAKPLVTLGQFACLRCTQVNKVGAFLDWGLPKELFVPFSHQHIRMVAGRSYVVFVCLDKAGRLMASSALARHFDYDLSDLEEGQKVWMMVYGRRDNAVMVVVNKRYSGVVYADRDFRRLDVGSEAACYVRKLREDNKVEVVLTQSGRGGVDAAAKKILESLEEAGGWLAVNDKSPPDEILERFDMSKKAFKRAVGNLLKADRIRFEGGGIERVED